MRLASASLRRASPSEVGMLSPASIQAVWESMRGIYGPHWEVGFGAFDLGSTSVKSWRRGLWAMTALQLRAGLAACASADDPTPPSLPEFRARCLGIPSCAAVLSCAGHPDSEFAGAVYEAAAAAGHAQASVDRADRILHDAYRVVRARVLQGLPPSIKSAPSVAKESSNGPKPAFRPCPPEVAARHVDRVRAILSGDEPPHPA